MPNDASRGELPKLGDYGNTNNIYDWQQKVYQGWPYHGPNSYQMPPYYGSHIYSNVFSPPTDANNQTQKPPYVPDVASKRPHTTSDEFCTSVRCAASGHKFRGCPNVVISPSSNAEVVAAKVAAAPNSTHADDATESPHRSNTSPRTSAADDEAVARSITVVSSETASNTHLDDRDGDIVLKEIRPYAQASIDPCHYVSTANRHIFHDRSAFETYDPVTEPAQACIKGFCRSMPVSYAAGRGTVRVEGRYGGRASSIRLTEVLHVPHARSNLISGVQLDKAGVTATLGNGIVTLAFEGANIIDGMICDGLYRLNMSVIRPSNAQSHP